MVAVEILKDPFVEILSRGLLLGLPQIIVLRYVCELLEAVHNYHYRAGVCFPERQLWVADSDHPNRDSEREFLPQHRFENDQDLTSGFLLGMRPRDRARSVHHGAEEVGLVQEVFLPLFFDMRIRRASPLVVTSAQ